MRYGNIDQSSNMEVGVFVLIGLVKPILSVGILEYRFNCLLERAY